MCSLEEAFQTMADGAAHYSNTSSDIARNSDSEKRKKKKRKYLLPPEPVSLDPDRPAQRPLPPAELLGGRAEQFESMPSAAGGFENDSYFPNPNNDMDDSNIYTLEPNWAKVFNDNSVPDWIKERMPKRNTDTPLQPTALLDGAPTLWQAIPDNFQKIQDNSLTTRMDDLQQKLDSMFSKLDEIEYSRAQSNHLEIIMFILGGLLLLFLLDLLVKQGTKAAFMFANAMGGASNYIIQ
jgi:hypothetical protein